MLAPCAMPSRVRRVQNFRDRDPPISLARVQQLSIQHDMRGRCSCPKARVFLQARMRALRIAYRSSFASLFVFFSLFHLFSPPSFTPVHLNRCPEIRVSKPGFRGCRAFLHLRAAWRCISIPRMSARAAVAPPTTGEALSLPY